jgi:hypothetical protein
VNRHALQQFIYVRDDSFPAASAASSAGTPPASARNGHATVQNLMASFDNITINRGSTPAGAVSSSKAANGHAAAQNLMTAFDNITINSGSAAGTPHLTAQNLLRTIDAITANPVKVTA